MTHAAMDMRRWMRLVESQQPDDDEADLSGMAADKIISDIIRQGAGIRPWMRYIRPHRPGDDAGEYEISFPPPIAKVGRRSLANRRFRVGFYITVGAVVTAGEPYLRLGFDPRQELSWYDRNGWPRRTIEYEIGDAIIGVIQRGLGREIARSPAVRPEDDNLGYMRFGMYGPSGIAPEITAIIAQDFAHAADVLGQDWALWDQYINQVRGRAMGLPDPFLASEGYDGG